jgi:hypothetical protein
MVQRNPLEAYAKADLGIPKDAKELQQVYSGVGRNFCSL